jgi:hypothetical protein
MYARNYKGVLIGSGTGEVATKIWLKIFPVLPKIWKKSSKNFGFCPNLLVENGFSVPTLELQRK